MIEVIIAIAIALLIKSVLDSKSAQPSPQLAQGPATDAAPQRKRLSIAGAGPAKVQFKEFALHAIPGKEVNDALCVEGPVSLAGLPAEARMVLEDCQKAGNVRGPRLADLLAGRRGLVQGERLLFVLLDNTSLGPRVVAFVSTAEYHPGPKS